LTTFCYSEIRWKNNEIYFLDAHLKGGRGKKFQVDGVKRVVSNKQKLYLCRIWVNVGPHKVDTFKIFVLDDEALKNFKPEDVQLMGQNIDGRFVFDKSFQDGMKRVTTHSQKIDLSGKTNDERTDNKNNAKPWGL
jgi:hypothetical protein